MILGWEQCTWHWHFRPQMNFEQSISRQVCSWHYYNAKVLGCSCLCWTSKWCPWRVLEYAWVLGPTIRALLQSFWWCRCSKKLHGIIANCSPSIASFFFSLSIVVDTGCCFWFSSQHLFVPKSSQNMDCRLVMFRFGQAIAVFLKSTTNLVDLDLSWNDFGDKEAEAWDSGEDRPAPLNGMYVLSTTRNLHWMSGEIRFHHVLSLRCLLTARYWLKLWRKTAHCNAWIWPTPASASKEPRPSAASEWRVFVEGSRRYSYQFMCSCVTSPQGVVAWFVEAFHCRLRAVELTAWVSYLLRLK